MKPAVKPGPSEVSIARCQSACRSDSRGTISLSPLIMARFSALEISVSRLLIVTRTETPEV